LLHFLDVIHVVILPPEVFHFLLVIGASISFCILACLNESYIWDPLISTCSVTSLWWLCWRLWLILSILLASLIVSYCNHLLLVMHLHKQQTCWIQP
jgi:hypothetical protein